MSRDIKFRAWDNYEKEWLMGYEPKRRIGFNLIGEAIACNEWANVLGELIRGEFGESGEDLIIQQFTGLKDKDGVDIYEGDILKCPWIFSPKNFLIGEVVFWEGAFGLSRGPEREIPQIVPYDFYSFNETPSRREMWLKLGRSIGCGPWHWYHFNIYIKTNRPWPFNYKWIGRTSADYLKNSKLPHEWDIANAIESFLKKGDKSPAMLINCSKEVRELYAPAEEQ